MGAGVLEEPQGHVVIDVGLELDDDQNGGAVAQTALPEHVPVARALPGGRVVRGEPREPGEVHVRGQARRDDAHEGLDRLGKGVERLVDGVVHAGSPAAGGISDTGARRLQRNRGRFHSWMGLFFGSGAGRVFGCLRDGSRRARRAGGGGSARATVPAAARPHLRLAWTPSHSWRRWSPSPRGARMPCRGDCVYRGRTKSICVDRWPPERRRGVRTRGAGLPVVLPYCTQDGEQTLRNRDSRPPDRARPWIEGSRGRCGRSRTGPHGLRASVRGLSDDRSDGLAGSRTHWSTGWTRPVREGGARRMGQSKLVRSIVLQALNSRSTDGYQPMIRSVVHRIFGRPSRGSGSWRARRS